MMHKLGYKRARVTSGHVGRSSRDWIDCTSRHNIYCIGQLLFGVEMIRLEGCIQIRSGINECKVQRATKLA